MANATARVARDFRNYRWENISRSWDTVSSKTQLLTGAAVGTKSNGYLAKFDDTQSLKFAGIILDDESLGGSQGPVLPNNGSTSGTAGDGTLNLDVKRVKAFVLNITGVAITDLYRRVYALDDQTGTLDPSATTYANLYGIVVDLVYATNPGSPVANYALVAPIYDIPQGVHQQVFSASGAIQLKASTVVLKGNSVLAMTLANPTASVHDGMEITILETGTGAHTVTTGTSGLNGASHIATFGGAAGNNVVLKAFNGSWYVISSVGIVLS